MAVRKGEPHTSEARPPQQKVEEAECYRPSKLELFLEGSPRSAFFCSIKAG
jgi:hypothetical protein